MARFRLKEAHPTMKKLDQLFRLADELGIRIEIASQNSLVVRDDAFPGVLFNLEDLESVGGWTEAPGEIPPSFEYKLIQEREE